MDPAAGLFEKSEKLPRPGRFWKVVGAGRDGLKVWQGVVGWVGGGVVEGGVLTAPHDVTGFKCMINNHGEFSKVPKAWGCGTPSKWPCPSWRF